MKLVYSGKVVRISFTKSLITLVNSSGINLDGTLKKYDRPIPSSTVSIAAYNNDITKLKSEIKEKTHKKKELTTSLVNVMKNNSIDCFDINGGALVYKQKKSRKTISGKFLLTQLEEYYKDNQDLAKEIAKKVLDNRIEVVKDEIKRKIDK
jgi:hypothetical protein